jgi:hypothetical protein
MALNIVFDDILWNLDTICRITNHRTLLVTGNRLSLDDRILQGLRRPFTFDSRDSTLDAIANTLNTCREAINSYRFSVYLNPPPDAYLEQKHVAKTMVGHLQEVLTRQEDVATGLTTLGTFERYIHDTKFQIKMAGFIKQFATLVDLASEVKEAAERHIAQTSYRTSPAPPAPAGEHHCVLHEAAHE